VSDAKPDAGPGPGGGEAGRGGTGTDDRPERPGTAAFLAALGVARNAKVGFAVGALLALALLALVVRGAEAAQYPVFLYAALAFVLAVGVGLLLTAVITVAVAVKRVRETGEPAVERTD
jgi:multisubunit Na+/H+ antiporter MnhE subunit